MKAIFGDHSPQYFDIGWEPIPLQPKSKTPIPESWTTIEVNAEVIQNWSIQLPNTNLGVRTGQGSGIVVLDLDGNFELDSATQPIPVTPMAQSGSGGIHYYFKHPGFTVKGTVRILQNEQGALDIRGDGQQVVVPPSIHPNGNVYEWIVTPWETEPQALPEWALKLLQESNKEPNSEVPKQITQGGRNETLTSFAGAMRFKGMAYDEILDGLVSINKRRCVPPLELSELKTIAVSVARYEPESPIFKDPPVRIQQSRNGRKKNLGSFNRTDLGNAKRLVHHHGENLRYCYPWDTWLIWDDVRWAPDDSGEIFRKAKDTVLQIYKEAHVSVDPQERKQIGKHALQSEGMSRLKAMIEAAESESGIPALPEALDNDLWLLNVQNGTLDLKTKALLNHSRDRLITKVAPVKYDADAQCPNWLAFLNRIMDDNDNLIDFLQRVVGYLLTGSTQEQVLFFLYGTGANGKSTFLETLTALLGEYAAQTPTDTLMIKRGGGVPNDVARLRGARFVSAVEADEGKRLAESLVKQLTGGDTITARFLHKEFFEFKPQFKLLLAANHKPIIRGNDNAIWRRIRLIPFTVTIPPEEQDRKLPINLREELSGILNWALEGCKQWQRDGLGLPDEVKVATDDYRAEMDTIGDFVTSCCLELPNAKVSAKMLYLAYKGWCDNNSERIMSNKWFVSKLTERGFSRSRGGTNGSYIWTGIDLIENEPETTTSN